MPDRSARPGGKRAQRRRKGICNIIGCGRPGAPSEMPDVSRCAAPGTGIGPIPKKALPA